ncbi:MULTISPECIES: iron-containing redox enzyme family protein [Pseudomonas]|uniref:iron-containing redox enzyme family protein n=1 Tax=Pseudomonas TaxID=286 RepID=UPI000CFB35FD|nr:MULTISPECIES: iron-containing redox enzyme family protein [Pseudomonas]PQZ90818.1 cupin [Pseudomonas trivialis]PRB26051.1 cupin [Pseudomonas sp. MYb60]
MLLKTSNSDKTTRFSLSHSESQALADYAKGKAFAQPGSFFTCTPYQRPLRPQDTTDSIFNTRLTSDQLSNTHALFAQRLLFNIYEQDMLFLPHPPTPFDLKELKAFYDSAHVAKGKTIRPLLEQYLYDWLRHEVHISGPWCAESFIAHTNEVLDAVAQSDSKLPKVLTNSRYPERAAKFFMVQCAGDFLSEASAMARNVLGNCGPHTSELFKILIDEYGYGVDKKKHSTLFEKMLKDMGMSHHAHHYWQFYTAGALSLTNYFHYVSANHSEFFRYIGALYYTEATLALTTHDQSEAFKTIFNGTVSTEYFDEHSHIDKYHGKMALERLILPMIESFGNTIIPDLIRGFEEFRLLQEIADEELYAHIKWHDELGEFRTRANSLHGKRPVDLTITEHEHELSVVHTHSNDELFWVESGELDFVTSPDLTVRLVAGEGIVIPKGMLHGTRIVSPSCTYNVTAI